MTQHQLWGGRFSGGMDELMAHLNNSMRFDVRLWDADIRGSMAYAQALAGAGIITKKEAAELQRGLKPCVMSLPAARLWRNPAMRIFTPRWSAG